LRSAWGELGIVSLESIAGCSVGRVEVRGGAVGPKPQRRRTLAPTKAPLDGRAAIDRRGAKSHLKKKWYLKSHETRKLLATIKCARECTSAATQAIALLLRKFYVFDLGCPTKDLWRSIRCSGLCSCRTALASRIARTSRRSFPSRPSWMGPVVVGHLLCFGC